MTYMSPSLLSRGTSFLISTGIHVAIGFALFASMTAGSPDAARKKGDHGEVLVVQLLPLPDGGAPAIAEESASPTKGHSLDLEAPGEPLGNADSGSARPPGSPPPGDGGAEERSGTEGVTGQSEGAPAPSGAEVQAFRTTLLRHIQRFQEYPPASRAAGEQGFARVRFVMDRFGRVVEAWIETSSGSRNLDAESLAAIRRAQPLPAPPTSWPQSFEVALPISFSLN